MRIKRLLIIAAMMKKPSYFLIRCRTRFIMVFMDIPLRWLCQKFGISPNCYYNYKKDAKRKYRERLAHIFELIKYVYYNNNRVIGYRAMRIFIKRYGYELRNTTMHKYMNKRA